MWEIGKDGTQHTWFFLPFWQFNLSLSTIPVCFFSLPLSLSHCSITPPGPSSAVCYNKQITAQTASWRGEKWHKAQEPNVSACCNDYNRGLILLVPLLQERQARSSLLTRSEQQINELMGDLKKKKINEWENEEEKESRQVQLWVAAVKACAHLSARWRIIKGNWCAPLFPFSSEDLYQEEKQQAKQRKALASSESCVEREVQWCNAGFFFFFLPPSTLSPARFEWFSISKDVSDSNTEQRQARQSLLSEGTPLWQTPFVHDHRSIAFDSTWKRGKRTHSVKLVRNTAIKTKEMQKAHVLHLLESRNRQWECEKMDYIWVLQVCVELAIKMPIKLLCSHDAPQTTESQHYEEMLVCSSQKRDTNQVWPWSDCSWNTLQFTVWMQHIRDDCASMY